MTARRMTAALGALGCAALAALPASATLYGRKRGPLPAIGGEGQGNAQGPVSANDIAVIENLGQRVPRGLVFSDGHGRRVALDDLLARGKPLLITMGYYRCPMLCNLVHEGLAKAVRAAELRPGGEFVGLSVSVDPDEDPRSANTNQGRLLRAIGHPGSRDWTFTVDRRPGAPAAKALADAVGFRYKYDEPSKQFAHAAVAFVLAPDGKISRYLYGVDFDARDLRFAVVEASGGRVGTSLDRVLLACFRYDPMAQRYTPYVWAFVRAGAFLCFLALVALLGALWWKELQLRRARRAA